MESWPFKVIDDGGNPKVEVEYLGETKQFSPQEISAMVLTKVRSCLLYLYFCLRLGWRLTFIVLAPIQQMKEIAEVKLGKKVEKAVITVPAYFNDNQRQVMKLFAARAG